MSYDYSNSHYFIDKTTSNNTGTNNTATTRSTTSAQGSEKSNSSNDSFNSGLTSILDSKTSEYITKSLDDLGNDILQLLTSNKQIPAKLSRGLNKALSLAQNPDLYAVSIAEYGNKWMNANGLSNLSGEDSSKLLKDFYKNTLGLDLSELANIPGGKSLVAKLLQTGSKTINAIAPETQETEKSKGSSVLDGIKGLAITAPLTATKGIFNISKSFFKGGFNLIKNTASPIIKAPFQMVKIGIKGSLKNIGSFVKGGVDCCKNVFSGFLSGTKKLFKGDILGWGKDIAGGVFKGAKSIVSGAAKGIWTGVKTAAKVVAKPFQAVGKAVGNAVSSSVKGIVDVGKSVVKGVGNAVKSVGKAIGKLFKGW